MSSTSTVTLDPEPAPVLTDQTGSGSGVIAEILARATREDYQQWTDHISGAAACEHPIRLTGHLHTVDTTTGEIIASRHTSTMPDGQLYTACGNRRATVCPACAETYRADTYQLILAGLRGGKGIPDTVSRHPCVFATFTAPSFGPVHARREKRKHKNQPVRVLPCRPRRKPEYCPHGVNLACNRTHTDGEKRLGQPLCARCYDYQRQVVWNLYSGELWRRTAQHIRRTLEREAADHGISSKQIRLSYAKVAEFQHRGAVHFHALFRLDGIDPDSESDGAGPLAAPPACLSWRVLEDAVRAAGLDIGFRTPAHPENPDGWNICWGEQLDVRAVRVPTDDNITDDAVAAYLAKYATKATETAGHVSARITPDTVDLYATEHTHAGRLIAACWDLGQPPATVLSAQSAWRLGHLRHDSDEPIQAWRDTYGRLRRWAHMLGYGGHFSTRSRTYSTTLRTLRKERQQWRRRAWQRTTDHRDDLHGSETTVIASSLSYAGIGWHTTGDAILANSTAARARERRLTARDETQADQMHSDWF